MSAGYTVFDTDPRVMRWAQAAREAVARLDTSERRHGRTWFVGVDALPNAPDGSIDGTPLEGPWPAHRSWHRAQVSIVYPGYPRQDAGESDVNHRFRLHRDAAHMDGLLPIGPKKRRYLKEPHSFILGLPLGAETQSPLVVWPGSHQIVGQAMAEVLRPHPSTAWPEIDLTDAYVAARRQVFDVCQRVEVPLVIGQSILLHRHLIHGVAPWSGPDAPDGRAVAYFRPQGDVADWL